MRLNEDFLHYIWQYRLLKGLSFCCSNGESLRIIHPGVRNYNAGPDFSVASLKIGKQLWVGNIEIHVKSSDWLLHRHQSDRYYDTVILHVVCEHDHVIYRTDGTEIPVFVIKDLIPEHLFFNYLQLLEGRSFFPCARQMSRVPPDITAGMLNKMIGERFSEKAAELELKLIQNINDWNSTFYYLLMRSFGFKVNAVPFELLANALPGSIISRHKDNPLQVEALLFGTAGFLEGEFKDNYPRALQAEYLFLQEKYKLKTAEKGIWKFMRIHPQNFPVLRIAQVAALLLSPNSFFTDLLKHTEIKAIKNAFAFAKVNIYWEDHSHFDKRCKKHPTQPGKQALESLIINAVSYNLYCYGKYTADNTLIQSAFNLLKTIPAERNALLLHYVKAGLKLRSAYDSQALLQLSKSFCSKKRCLECEIGINLIGLRH